MLIDGDLVGKDHAPALVKIRFRLCKDGTIIRFSFRWKCPRITDLLGVCFRLRLVGLASLNAAETVCAVVRFHPMGLQDFFNHSLDSGSCLRV